MQPTYTLVESLDDDGWYAEFWDYQTGKSIVNADGNLLHTDVHPERYQANKAAKRIRRETDWTQYNLQEGPGTINQMMFAPGEKTREYWTFCSNACGGHFFPGFSSEIPDVMTLDRQDVADLFAEMPGYMVIECNTCHKQLSTRGYTPDRDTDPTDIIWWWER